MTSDKRLGNGNSEDMNMMGRKWLVLLGLFVIALGPAGCITYTKNILPPGSQKNENTIEGRIEATYDKIWIAVRETVSSRGQITVDSIESGHLEGNVGPTHINLWLYQITQRSGSVRIQAYQPQTNQPDIPLASEIFTAIMKKASQ